MPELRPTANATDRMMTGNGYLAAKVPHHVKKFVMLFSKLAPSLSKKLRSSSVIFSSGGFTT